MPRPPPGTALSHQTESRSPCYYSAAYNFRDSRSTRAYVPDCGLMVPIAAADGDRAVRFENSVPHDPKSRRSDQHFVLRGVLRALHPALFHGPIAGAEGVWVPSG
jgi:hypothetical protein